MGENVGRPSHRGEKRWRDTCTSLLDQFAADVLAEYLPIPPMMLRILRVFRVLRILRLQEGAPVGVSGRTCTLG